MPMGMAMFEAASWTMQAGTHDIAQQQLQSVTSNLALVATHVKNAASLCTHRPQLTIGL